MTPLTEYERGRFAAWIAANVDETLVPGDEGNGDGLIYNLIQKIYGSDDRYAYRADQHAVLEEYGIDMRDAYTQDG